jgi:hypothetical protein
MLQLFNQKHNITYPWPLTKSSFFQVNVFADFKIQNYKFYQTMDLKSFFDI